MPGWANTVIDDLLSEIGRLDERIAQYDQHIRHIARQDSRAQRLTRLNGVGETTATCLVAMIGNGHDFDCGRQFAAWLGLVPGQYSSGGKARLGRITKAGDWACPVPPDRSAGMIMPGERSDGTKQKTFHGRVQAGGGAAGRTAR
ncbi:transposase IS116/IS110/IS902 [Thauera linaloolentis 47Lol = DSM 12138]|uniref:Transposase IS116/IS110/IS902 n=1 Tax=Thauera linaloolentis (strain DSM 12138 / JCM 21573 / CCUG 41526 / CIP 105981 / IAM 15112 / NBRC 102519 / 47Lol) TaxID=1123367 RepID=N6YUA0_THAL4|nr:transposase IS116/IS110/IS902 [Thauera linaloolentis 47Lol = DSM 12138]